MDERQQLQRRVGEYNREITDTRLEMNKRDTEEAATLTKYKVELEAQTKELEELQARYKPLRDDHELAHKQVAKLQESLDRANREVDSMTARVAKADDKFAQMLRENQAAQSKVRQLETQLQEEQSKSSIMEREAPLALSPSLSRLPTLRPSHLRPAARLPCSQSSQPLFPRSPCSAYIA